jgi:tripartite ATP-independent transporter DctM subunit
MAPLVAIVIALLGAPLFIVMALSAIMNNQATGVDQVIVPIEFYTLTQKPMLQTLPLFAFAGYLLARSGAPARLLRLARACFGWMPGGLVVVTVVSCSIMTAFTGASGVTIIALGGLLLPALAEDGYDHRFNLGVVTAGGSLGLLFAPSLPIILYAVITETSAEQLFRAGLIPGLLIVALLSAYGFWKGIRCKVPRQKFSLKELGTAFWHAKWEAPMPAVIVAGIYNGWFTISDAAVVAAAWVLVAEVIVYRDVKLVDLGRIARESTVLVGGILVILGMTVAVTNYMIDQQIPTQLFEAVSGVMTSKVLFLLVLNLFLLAVGCMIDIYAAIVLIVPLLLPIAAEFGVDPIHLGIIFLTNLGIGYCTPPVGLNLFIASIRFKESVFTLYRAALPFLAILLAALVAITLVPQISLALVESDDPNLAPIDLNEPPDPGDPGLNLPSIDLDGELEINLDDELDLNLDDELDINLDDELDLDLDKELEGLE